jgi:branched-chain amino acid transport system substrate-binding protein
VAATAAQAQQTVYMPIVIEVSGNGAVSGTNFRDGALMAIDEINAKGGILSRKINAPVSDTQSNPGVSRAQVQKAIDGDPYVILGPVFSGSVKVNMLLAQQAEIPQMTGAEAAEITQMGNDYIFRTSFGQQMSMPKMAAFVASGMKAKSVAFLWVNNDYGKGGRDVFFKEMAARNIKIVRRRIHRVGPGRLRRRRGEAERRQRRRDLRLYQRGGERALPSRGEEAGHHQAADRRDHAPRPESDRHGRTVANGAKGHVGLSADAPVPAVLAWKEKFVKRFGYVPDHNGIKGYTGVYAVKYATQKLGKFDRKALAKSLHGMTIKPEEEPGILMETTWDANGDVDRISFLAEVVDGKQKIVQTLPKLGK